MSKLSVVLTLFLLTFSTIHLQVQINSIEASIAQLSSSETTATETQSIVSDSANDNFITANYDWEKTDQPDWSSSVAELVIVPDALSSAPGGDEILPINDTISPDDISAYVTTEYRSIGRSLSPDNIGEYYEPDAEPRNIGGFMDVDLQYP